MASKDAKAFVGRIKVRQGRFIGGTPGGGMGFGGSSPKLKEYQGVRIGGKKYTRFSQFDVTPARKKTLKQKMAGGIKLAIL